ncbi:MAG: ATP-binding protein [Chloroflexota bacterium]|nr:ATP-binding protein [Chloroflexota bacterium]
MAHASKSDSTYDSARWDAVRLAQQNAVLSALLMAMPFLPNVAGTALEITGSLIGASRGCLLLLNKIERGDAIDRVDFRAFYAGFDPVPDDEFAERLFAQGLVGYALYERRPILVRDLRYDPRYPQPDELAPSSIPSTGSAVAVPLRLHDDIIGALVFFRDEVDSIDGDAIRLLELLAGSIAGAVRGASQVDGIQMTLANVNYKRIAQNAADQVQRDLRAMTYHDLRAPLMAIQHSLTAAERLMLSGKSESAADIMRTAGHSARQMGRMVKSLLDLERLEEGRAVVTRQSHPLQRLLADAAELALPLIRAAEQTLVFDVDSSAPAVSVDSDMIARVIVNLAENATKYSPRGGTVTLAARAQSDFVVVSVIDTGHGIPVHLRDEVFDKYFRVKQDGTARGVGLGLAFCRLAIEAHGGRIWVDSTESGGSEFAFTLPLAQQGMGEVAAAAV